MTFGIITSNFSVDVVGVFTQDFKQVFPRARAIKATVKPDSKLMTHPVETGATVADHRIILQTEIELSLILQAADYRDTYQNILQLFTNGTILIVHTKASVYSNFVIAAPPHDESTDIFDALALGLKLTEVQFASAQYGAVVVPKNPTNASTVDRGNQQTRDANVSQTTVAQNLFSGIKKHL